MSEKLWEVPKRILLYIIQKIKDLRAFLKFLKNPRQEVRNTTPRENYPDLLKNPIYGNHEFIKLPVTTQPAVGSRLYYFFITLLQSLPVGKVQRTPAAQDEIYLNLMARMSPLCNDILNRRSLSFLKHEPNWIHLYFCAPGRETVIPNAQDILRGLNLHYVESGSKDKELLLLVHGFPDFWFTWKRQIAELSTNYWVVAVDMRGYGDTEKSKTVSFYEINLLVDDLRNLVLELAIKTSKEFQFEIEKYIFFDPNLISEVRRNRHNPNFLWIWFATSLWIGETIQKLINYLLGAGRDKFTLIAHDWGGVVAHYFIRIHPQMLNKYILMNTVFHPKLSESLFSDFKQFLKSWYIMIMQIPYYGEYFFLSDDLKKFEILYEDVLTPEELQIYKFMFGSYERIRGPINYYRANFKDWRKEIVPNAEKLNKENVPGLYIHGEDDFAITLNTAFTVSFEDVKNIQLICVPNAGHFVHLHSPEKVNKIITNFLKSPGAQSKV